MRDAGTAIRRSFIDALKGNLTLGSLVVPVVDGKLEEMPADGVFVVFGGQTDTDKSNKSKFVFEVSIDMAVVNKRKNTSSKKDVEAVSDQILQIIRPDPVNHGLTIDPPFSITTVRYTTGVAETLATDAANTFIQVKRLQFINRITQ